MTTTLAPPRPPAEPRPNRGNGWFLVGAIATAITLALGSIVAAGWLGLRTETDRQEYRGLAMSTGTGAPAVLFVQVEAADLTVVGGQRTAVTVTSEVTWAFSRPTSSQQLDGQLLRLTGGCGSRVFPACDIRYTVEVPGGVEVWVSTTTTDVTIRDFHSDLHVTTTSGDVRATGLVARRAEVTTDAGDVWLDFASAPYDVAVKTAAGDIDIVMPTAYSAYQVSAESGTGSVAVTVLRNDSSDWQIRARSGTGDIDIRHAKPKE